MFTIHFKQESNKNDHAEHPCLYGSFHAPLCLSPPIHVYPRPSLPITAKTIISQGGVGRGGGRVGRGVSQSSSKNVPDELDWLQIRRAGGPVHPGDPLLLLDVCDDPSGERRGVGVLQTDTRSLGSQSRWDGRARDVVPVA